MKAVYCMKYGSPEHLILKDVPKPELKADELMVRIHASAVTASDIYIRSLELPFKFRVMMRIIFGFTKPRQPILGITYSGVVESVGSEIQRFKPGDQVYGLTGYSLGTYAEYKAMKETDSPRRGTIALKPKNLSHEEATAAAYGGLLAFQYTELGKIQPGQKVLVYGASGTSGTMAVQLAKHLGAEVTGVCSGKNMAMVKALGADKVLDYTDQASVDALETYAFILDSVGGSKTSMLKEKLRECLIAQGKYVSIDDGNLLLDSARLDSIRQAVESGAVQPKLDRIYPLSQIQEAHAYVQSGHKTGGVAISI